MPFLGNVEKGVDGKRKFLRDVLGLEATSSFDSLRPAAAQPQRQCRSGPRGGGPTRNSITRLKGAEPGGA